MIVVGGFGSWGLLSSPSKIFSLSTVCACAAPSNSNLIPIPCPSSLSIPILIIISCGVVILPIKYKPFVSGVLLPPFLS